jgi:hypothetical protein
MDQIKSFVQQTLGCRCPDAVFEHVEIERDIQTDNGIFLHSRVNIGNRLLIYVIEQKGSSFNPDELPNIIHGGIHERYKYGFNRFRLVLTLDGSEKLRQTVENIFDTLPDKDDKTHLHIIDKEDLPF